MSVDASKKNLDVSTKSHWSVAAFDFQIDVLRSVFTRDRILAFDQFMTIVGLYGIVSAGVLFTVGCVYAGYAFHETSFIITGLLAPFVFFLLLYVSAKMVGATDRLSSRSRTTIAEKGLVDCSAAILLFIALFSGIGGIVLSIYMAHFWIMPTGLAIMVVLFYYVSIFIHLEILGVEINPKVSIGEEALALLSMNFKILFKLTPVIFGIGMLAVNAAMLWGIVLTIQDRFEELAAMVVIALFFTLYSALAPLWNYIVALYIYLLVDFVRSMLLVGRIADAALSGKK